jgi:hypothetical protein
MLATMAYKHACFISYKRPPRRLTQGQTLLGRPRSRHLWIEFAEAFQETLDKYLTHLPSFRDQHLQPGDDYPQELATNLCKSVCMVALIVPEYFESAWCRAEWRAMELWEEKRHEKGRAQLIIPIICTGDPNLLEAKIHPRQAIDLRYIVSPNRQMSSIRTLTTIRDVADKINNLAKILPVVDIDCEAYSLGAVGSDLSTPEFREPSPFR